MGNLLFQQARQAVEHAENHVKLATTPEQIALAVEQFKKAKNDLSSAFAHSSVAEKRQLAEMQQQLDHLEHSLPEYH
ncbi:MAG: DUF3813 domain-containing protein [Bacillaceae bacterium]|nr:DUF3813 domain-containing protein [Bacillaceae bacterium]